MTQRILAYFCILFLLNLSALADQTTSPIDPVTPLSPAGISLKEDLLAGVKTLNQNIQLFHYFHAPTDTSNSQLINPYLFVKENRDKWLLYFFGFRTGAFWDENNHVTEMTASGPGMYFAIDPSASREFGESAVVLNLTAGTKYLSVAKSISLRKQTRELLVKENIISKAQLNSGDKSLGLSRGFSADTLKNMVREENSQFRKLLAEVFNRNKIILVEYQWKSFLAGFCKDPSQSAFVLVGLKPELSNQDNGSGQSATKEVLGQIPDEIKQNFYFFSDFEVNDLSETERQSKDVLSRFRAVLSKIKEKGTTKAQKYISQNLNDEEVTELAGKTFRCERRY